MLGLSGKREIKNLWDPERNKQGSVLSPALFLFYMDDLFVLLRKSGAGCHLGGVFAGSVGYADDLLLLSPSRSGMEKMLRICEQYAMDTNLHKYSTHPDPVKSKSKCIFMSGHMKAKKSSAGEQSSLETAQK